MLEEVAVPLHLVGHIAIVLVTFQGSKCHSLGEAIVAQVLVGIVQETFVSLTHEAEAHTESGQSIEFREGSRDDEVRVLPNQGGNVVCVG